MEDQNPDCFVIVYAVDDKDSLSKFERHDRHDRHDTLHIYKTLVYLFRVCC